MKQTWSMWLRPVLFTLVGALIGLGYYYFVGCPTGTCPITSSAASTAVYTGLIGWLVSYVFGAVKSQ